jgi:HD-GYP domain-containing protein (c-di-GMP phosphodiesterase class II)
VTRTLNHPDLAGFSGRLKQRLTELGVATVMLRRGGRPGYVCEAGWGHKLVIDSPVFASAVDSRWDELNEKSQSPIELWPGAVLVPLPVTNHPGSAGDNSADAPAIFAVLLDTTVVHGDQFRLACDQGEADYQAAVSRIQTELLAPSEAKHLATVIGWMARDARDLSWRLSELHDLSWELAGSYEELSLLYKLSTSMVVDHPPGDFLKQACAEMREVVGLRWLAIQLLPDEPGFESLSVPVCVDCHSRFDTSLIQEAGPELIEALRGQTEPRIIDDVRVLGVPSLERFAHSLLLTPLHIEGKLIGLLYGADKIEPGSGLSTVDSKLCASLGSSLSIYLKNVLLYEDMHSMFIGTLHALSTTIDAKDSYTQGHSERVALMSRQLAQAAGLDEYTVGRVYLSALVHDVGKIGVPESVLTKPGKLTKEEFDLVKQHPETGARILEGIRQMKDLIPGVLHHHEAWDGSGYPYGLAGLDIPLFGRILGLADAFDAMSSDRTYRLAMPMNKVLDEVRRCSGKQFDPELADIFIGLEFKPYTDMISKQVQLRRSA